MVIEKPLLVESIHRARSSDTFSPGSLSESSLDHMSSRNSANSLSDQEHRGNEENIQEGNKQLTLSKKHSQKSSQSQQTKRSSHSDDNKTAIRMSEPRSRLSRVKGRPLSPTRSLSTSESSQSLSHCLSPVQVEDALSPSSSQNISPFLAHYHKFSAEDLPLHVSIAQGGLQRIRREAQSAQVSLRDIVDIFGRSITNMAKNGDEMVKRMSRHSSQPKPINSFNGAVVPKIPVSDYLWRIVRALNAHSDPALFASDGSDLSMLTSSSSSSLPTTGLSSWCSSDHLDQQSRESTPCGMMSPLQRQSSQITEGENSAMGRGLRCLLLAFVYIDRACTRHPWAFQITSLSVHRIILAAIYVATKFTDDTLPRVHWTFAKLGGVSCRELKMLEGTFCSLVDFRFYITEAEFQAHCMEQLRCAVRSVRAIKEARVSE